MIVYYKTPWTSETGKIAKALAEAKRERLKWCIETVKTLGAHDVAFSLNQSEPWAFLFKQRPDKKNWANIGPQKSGGYSATVRKRGDLFAAYQEALKTCPMLSTHDLCERIFGRRWINIGFRINDPIYFYFCFYQDQLAIEHNIQDDQLNLSDCIEVVSSEYHEIKRVYQNVDINR